jgi:rhamnose utilization protein RhaD (predicted bifunctional aldolase and dehydrogenase)
MTELNELITLAQRLGNHPARLALWAEGAVASKCPNGKFAVSAAGANLGRLEAGQLVELDLARMQAFLALDEAPEEKLAEAKTDPAGPAPDAGAFMFADLFAFEQIQVAAHTQPIAVNQVLCSPRARQFADRRNLPHEILACGQASVLVPFFPPGLPLAKEIKRKIVLWRDRYKIVPKLILLQNHGMIALGESIDEVVMITEMTVKFAEIFLGAAMLGGPEFMKPNFVTQIEATRTA